MQTCLLVHSFDALLDVYQLPPIYRKRVSEYYHQHYLYTLIGSVLIFYLMGAYAIQACYYNNWFTVLIHSRMCINNNYYLPRKMYLISECFFYRQYYFM